MQSSRRGPLPAFVSAVPSTVGRVSATRLLCARRPTPALLRRRQSKATVRALLGGDVASAVMAAAALDPSAVAPVLHLAEVTEVNYNSLAVTALVFVLTFWGSVSFVKGSIKARVTQASFSLPVPAKDVARTVTRYLTDRGFTPDNNKDPRPGVVTFEGTVRASSSVAIILVLVAASGLWAGSLILNVLLPETLKNPNLGWISVLSLAIVPWYKGQAERVEEVKVMVEEADEKDRLASSGSASGESHDAKPTQSVLFVKAHRDEIITMEQSLGWVRNDPDGEEAQRVVAQAMGKASAAPAVRE